MIVHTGLMPSALPRRSRPRSTASATASDCGTVKHTVALMLTPCAVSSSIAAMPACVAGTFTCMFGASDAKWSPCSTSRGASR